MLARLTAIVFLTVLLSCTNVGLTTTQAAEPDPLLKAAETIYQKAKGKYKTVGVLKIQVQKGTGELDDNFGTINMSLTRRLELALIFCQKGVKGGPPEPEDELLIIKNASLTVAAASQTKGFTHLTEEGRKQFFALKYQPYWGLKEVQADAFIIGKATLTPDLKKIKIKLSWFSKTGEEALCEFERENSATDLVLTGQSFVTRGESDAFTAANALTKPGQNNPFAAEAQPPVILRIEYGDKEVPIRWKDGKGEIDELSDKDKKVKLILERTQEAKEHRLAVVLKVNGLNTLYEEQHPLPLNCSKWLLEKAGDRITIHGFQINQKEANEFRIVTPEQYKSHPKLGSLYYGQETGTIEMVVFQESKQPLPKTTDPLQSVLMSERQGSSSQQPESRDEIKRQIAKELPQTRNLLASGDKLMFEVKSVTFLADPKPIMSTTIKYWKNN